MFVVGYPLLALIGIVNSILFLLTILILAFVISNLIGADRRNPIIDILHKLVIPILWPVQKRLPSFNGFDFSPLVIILGIEFVRQGILPILHRFALQLIG